MADEETQETGGATAAASAAHVPPQAGPHRSAPAPAPAAAPPQVPAPTAPLDDVADVGTGGDVGGEDGELPPSDAELTDAVRAGDDAAYAELYRRHSEAVRRYARTCCRDSFTAEDLAGEVFAATLQALRAGKGPTVAVRAYLLTAVRNIAAAWTRSDRREQLVDDFQVFAATSAAVVGVDATDPGADTHALAGVDQSLVLQAFLELDAADRLLLWHTEVEQEPPREVAVLLGKTANATAVQAHRARDRLAAGYLQAHVASAQDDDCASYARRLGSLARGGLGKRAEAGVRAHLQECDRCSAAYLELVDLNGSLRAALPAGLLVWLGASGYGTALAAGLVGGAAVGGAAAVATATTGAAGTAAGTTAAAGAGAAGAGAAGAGGASGAAGAAAGGAAGAGGSSGGAAAGAASEGMGVAAKAGIAAAVAVAAAAGLAFALTGHDTKPPAPARHRPSPAAARPAPPIVPLPTPSHSHPAPLPPPPPAPRAQPTPPPKPSPKPSPRPKPSPKPSPRPSPKPSPSARPTPTPTPSPAPASYYVDALNYGGLNGSADAPTLRGLPTPLVWQRTHGVTIGGTDWGRGITMYAPTTALIDLNRPCTAFDAHVGIDDVTRGWGAAVFTVTDADTGRVLWSSDPVHGGDAAVTVHVSLSGVHTLALAAAPAPWTGGRADGPSGGTDGTDDGQPGGLAGNDHRGRPQPPHDPGGHRHRYGFGIADWAGAVFTCGA